MDNRKEQIKLTVLRKKSHRNKKDSEAEGINSVVYRKKSTFFQTVHLKNGMTKLTHLSIRDAQQL